MKVGGGENLLHVPTLLSGIVVLLQLWTDDSNSVCNHTTAVVMKTIRQQQSGSQVSLQIELDDTMLCNQLIIISHFPTKVKLSFEVFNSHL